MFAWYWLADLCLEEKVPFVLGHALYMKAIHGGKAKTDKIDAHKIAVLLRGGMLPQAYVYPKGMRETRDLLRRRTSALNVDARLKPGTEPEVVGALPPSTFADPPSGHCRYPNARRRRCASSLAAAVTGVANSGFTVSSKPSSSCVSSVTSRTCSPARFRSSPGSARIS